MATETRTVAPGIVVRTPPPWGIEPVPAEQRHLNAVDIAVLWGDLGVGLLVLVAGALLVPGLSLRDAFLAIAAGSLIGSALLGVGGYIGARVAVPTMVLTRGVLGLRGSYLPTALNVLQLIGWATFEVFVMAQVAAAITRQAFGLESYAAWAVFFASAGTLMAFGGPIVVVRQWLERFAIWVVLATSAFLFAYVMLTYDVVALFAAAGTGELAFWAGVDLVVAMPVSWFPLVADYNRFARRPAATFWATFASYTVANFVFFGLGALLVRALGTGPFELTGALVAALSALAVGWVALLIVLVDETDQAFANIYSTALSVQNVLSRVPQRALVVAIGALVLALALLVSIAEYEVFLFLIGAFFVPLLGVLAADFFVVRRGYETAELYRSRGSYWYTGGFNIPAVAIWLLGFVVYQWASPTPIPAWRDALGGVFGVVGLPFPLAPDFGGTIPSFVLAFVAYSLIGRIVART
jgi:NCS1 family nucleobase:cation symporter-1